MINVNEMNFLPIGLMVRKVGESIDKQREAFATAKYRESFRKQLRTFYKLSKDQVCDESLELHHIIQREFEARPVGCTGAMPSRWFLGTSAFGNLTLLSVSEHEAIHRWNDKYLPRDMRPGDDPVYLRALVPVRYGVWNLSSIKSGNGSEVGLCDIESTVEEIDRAFSHFDSKGRRLRSLAIEGVNSTKCLNPLVVDIAKFNNTQAKISPDVAYDFVSNLKVLEPFLPPDSRRKTFVPEGCTV